ncbi:MAG: type I glyceraldehyde-3-phosphate dehydrogenase [Syntrophotaleaceae bacterium]
MVKVAINGLGRIGRAALKILLQKGQLDVVAVNDLIPPDGLAYLLRFDTVYGRHPQPVVPESDGLTVGDRKIRVLSEKDPAELPWDQLGVDVVLECTGRFTRREDLEKHLAAGARKAILSAPAKGGGIDTVIYGVNTELPDQPIVSCASCTTNCITPLIEILGRRIGVEKAMLSTVHAYTGSQALVDTYNKKARRGRAAAANLVPTSTGAAIATTRVLTQYDGKFDGVAVRAPVPAGSVADVVALTSRPTSVEEVNDLFREEAAGDRYRGIVGVTEEALVSSDILGDDRASVVDLAMTMVVDGDMVKVMSWYDNEWGYANQMIRTATALAGK